MKYTILTLSLLFAFNSLASAAHSPAAASNFEDPNNVYSDVGSSYNAAKKKLGGCSATAPGDTTGARLIRANALTVDSPTSNAFTRASASRSSI